MSKFEEVKNAMKILRSNKCKKISLLHCVSSYPANITSCNLNSINFLRDKFKCPVGWSDHTVNQLLIYSAINNHLADYVELHVDLDGEGWENQSGNHCWMPNDIKNLMNYLKNEVVIEGLYNKKVSKEEYKRKFRADPDDGLRPIKNLERFIKC